MRRNTLALTLAAATLAVVALLARPVQGQVPSNGDVTAALLVEVRGLRAAIEQLASSNARIQLAIGRLQIQEQRVNALLRQQMEVRQRLADAERAQAEGEARLADLADVVRTISEPGERQAIVQEIGALKMTVAAGITALQKMRSDDADLSGLVSTEQGRWNAINEELDSLNRVLRQP
jgi:chromosome segregation ATPase